MRTLLTLSALAFAVTLTGFSASSVSAQDFELSIGRDGPQVRMRDDCNPRREDCRDRRDDRNFDRRDDRRSERGCTPDRALDKADRMGIRRARIADVGRRTIDVVGRSRHGNRVIVSFDRRDRRCGVIG
jgi:hypothetical protein